MRYFKLLARKILIPVLYSLGLERLFSAFSSPRYLILNYHGVVKKLQSGISRNHQSVEQFEQHLEYFSKHFDVISLQSMLDRYRQGIRPEKPTVSITFDDGYENNFLNAYPLLRRYQFPASIFITAQAITKPDEALWYDALDIAMDELNWDALLNSDQKKIVPENFKASQPLSITQFKNKFKELDETKKKDCLHFLLPSVVLKKKLAACDSEYWKLLNPEQIREMAASGLIEIGSHGLTHTNLDVLKEEALKSELRLSKELLENVTARTVISIAYPDGAYTEKVKQLSKEASYKNLLAVNYRCPDDRSDDSIFPRHSIPNTTTTASVMIGVHRAFNKSGF